MSERSRVALAPGWLLHRYAYRETSVIAEVLTRDYGRIGLVARGARAPGRRAVPVLGPFAPMLFSFRQGAELASLDKAESAGSGYRLMGEAFLAGCYVNELLLRLLPRGDAAPEVYTLYENTLQGLVDDTARSVRHFEGRVLSLLGYLPSLTRDASGRTLEPGGFYRYDKDLGLVAARQGESTEMLLAIAHEAYADERVLKAAARLFRAVIGAHLHGRPLRSLDVARAISVRGKEVS
ncbi:MAG TPA: DNA repair protein RecO [Gammaproteobacteria bacterium]|nr:DNA repair protein RecO [Gammaproteobacteria bacterium]